MQRVLNKIDEQRSKWIQAINHCSADDFVDIISDDAVWLPPGKEAINGKENIRAWLEKSFGELIYNYSVSDVSIRIAGDWAIEQAKFTSNVSTKAGEELSPHKGLYTLLWKKSKAGTWLIERYIDHSAEFIKVDQESAT